MMQDGGDDEHISSGGFVPELPAGTSDAIPTNTPSTKTATNPPISSSAPTSLASLTFVNTRVISAHGLNIQVSKKPCKSHADKGKKQGFQNNNMENS